MVHVMRWLAIIGMIYFFVWLKKKDYGTAYRSRDKRHRRKVW